jgi:hypothetical protein
MNAQLDAMKPDDREHHPGQRGNALEQRQDRRQELVDRPRAHHQQRQNAANQEGAGKARQNAKDGGQHVGEHRPGREYLEAAAEHVDQRRKQEARKEQRGELPDQDDHDKRKRRRPQPFQRRNQKGCQRR